MGGLLAARYIECARPTGGSHGLTIDDATQRFKGAKRRPRWEWWATRQGNSAARGIIEAGARKPCPGRSGCYSPRCLILCAVVALRCSRARGGRSSITRWSSTSVSRTSTHSSAYCASLASPISSICRSLSSIALFWLGAVHPEGYPGPGRLGSCMSYRGGEERRAGAQFVMGAPTL